VHMFCKETLTYLSCKGAKLLICISFHQKSSCKLYLRSIRHNVRLSNTGIHFEKNVILASSSWLKYSLTFPIISYWSTPSVNGTLLLLWSHSIHIIRSNSLLWLSLGTVDNCFVAYLNNWRKIWLFQYSLSLIILDLLRWRHNILLLLTGDWVMQQSSW
jgi:hypothetical protein